MKTFWVKFKAGSLELEGIVTASNRYQKFKVEMITGEPNPIILKRLFNGEWIIESPGKRRLSAQQYQELQKTIDKHVHHLQAARKILVITDFSETALNAAKYAAGLTHQVECASIIVYHSHNLRPLSAAALNPIHSKKTLSAEDIQEKLEKLKEGLEALVAADTHIEVITDGRPLSAAVNAITEQRQIGLVVMGMSGENTIAMTNESNTSLLVVPAHATIKKIKNIVFACNLNDVARTVPVNNINTLLEITGAKLSILYLNKTATDTRTAAKSELNKLKEIWSEKDVNYYPIDQDNAEKEIIEFTDEHKMELLITIPMSYGFFERLFHRSLSDSLAYITHIPLMLLKANS